MSNSILQGLSGSAIDSLQRHNLVMRLVKAEIISEAVSDIELSAETSNHLWEGHIKKHNLKEQKDIRKHLSANGVKEEHLRWQLELPARIREKSIEMFKHKAEARFLKRKESLDRVVYSLIRVKDGHLSRELYLRISEKEASFADVAAEFSEGHEANTKGIIGPVPLTQAHPALAERLRTSQPGQLCEPLKIGSWWVLARLERYEPAKFDNLTSDRMASELFGEWINEECRCRIIQLELDGAKITQ